MSKSIALLAVMALALCSAAQGQSITWVEKGGTTGSSLYLPRLASDYFESFLAVGQQSTALGSLGYLPARLTIAPPRMRFAGTPATTIRAPIQVWD